MRHPWIIGAAAGGLAGYFGSTIVLRKLGRDAVYAGAAGGEAARSRESLFVAAAGAVLGAIVGAAV